jgi:hypothetical protein
MAEFSAHNPNVAEAAVLESPARHPNDDRIDCMISRLNFQRTEDVMAVFRSSTKAGRRKLIIKLCSLDTNLLFRYLMSNANIRQEYLLVREEAHPNGILARQNVVRKVINNRFISTGSTKYYGVCRFDPVSITTFLMSTMRMIWG